MGEGERILYEALLNIAAIKTSDCAQYVKIADQIAIDALVKHELLEN